MAVIISNGATTLNTANGFYNVEASNLGCFHATLLALTTTRTIAVTFANSGNCQGIVLQLITTSMTSRLVTVTLQENVAGTWTTRATKTLTPNEIAGTKTSGKYKYHGQYITPFIFDTPYSVDTTASKWRFQIAHGTGTGTWNLRTSNASAPFYATWCDNPATFADGDVLIIKDKVIIDKTATTGAVLGTGDAVEGVGVVICSNSADPTPDNVALLEWENPAVASYEFTVRGQIVLGAYSGIRIGTEDARIPLAQRATFTFGTLLVGTTTPKMITPTTVAANTYGGLGSFFVYGEIPTHQKTFLTADALVGQNKLLVEDEVDWVAGDQVVIGKQDVTGQGETSIYTIDSVSGNEITLTTNLLTYKRLSGGSVIKLGGHGVLIKSNEPQTHRIHAQANFQISGADLLNQGYSNIAGTTYYYLMKALDPSCRSQYLVRDCAVWTTTTAWYIFNMITPPDGILVERVYCHRVSFATGLLAYSTALFKSGRATFKDSVAQCIYSGNISISVTIQLTIENNRFENARASTSFCSFVGSIGIFKNNLFFGNATDEATGGAVGVRQCLSPLEISGNTYQKNIVGMVFFTALTVRCLEKNAVFSSNTKDISFQIETFPDYVFDSPTGISFIDDKNLAEMILGGSVRFSNLDAQYDDRAWYLYGRIRRCKAGLSDETVHTVGGNSMRFNSLTETEVFEFPFDVPTGNIQDKDMSIVVWTKIGNANYWAGTHQLPRLTVTYDGGTVAYAQASESTEWQMLIVPFRPTTSTGKVSVTLSGGTDAIEVEGYFYFADISVLYPAGYKLDLGSLNIWDAGLPVLPPIATVMSASDVWAVDKSTLTGSGSIGEHLAKKVLSVSKFLGLK